MSIWVWFVIAGALTLLSRTIALTTPHHAESARRIGLTVVLTALGLAVAHAVLLRDSDAAIRRHTVAATSSTMRAQESTDRKLRHAQRQAQIARRVPVIRKRLLVAAYAGERGMYEGRVAYLEHCAGCHAADGGGVPDQPRSPGIIGLGEREREALIPYLRQDHALPFAGVIEPETLVQIEAFLWAGLQEAM